MSADELDAFVAAQPSGAICVTDEDGRLLALPARILDEDGGCLRVELADTELASVFDHERHGCVVAESFESYDTIRGVIVRGSAVRTDAATPHVVVALTIARTATFSFADGRAHQGELRR
jgi:hypothetical protein